MIVMVANAFVMNNAAAGAISVRPEAAGTAAGAMGFLQQGIGALVSQFGAYLGGHSTTTLPLTAAIFALSIACASAMFFLVPRRDVVVSEELMKKAEEEESGDAVRDDPPSSLRGAKRRSNPSFMLQQSWIASLRSQ